MTNTYSRVYFDKSLGRLADEHIEVPYSHLSDERMHKDDRAAIPGLIDPYGRLLVGDHYVSIEQAFCSHLQAKSWARQFGFLIVSRARGQFRARINGHCYVYGRTMQQATILAGLQVLREASIDVLNTAGTAH